MKIYPTNIDFLNPKDGNLDYCMVSGSKNLSEVIDLGNQPLCDSLLNNLNQDKDNEKFYPLKLMVNYELGYSQLSHIVPGNEVYHSDYPYRPGITKEIVDHHRYQANENIKTYSIKKKSLVVDIGSNDGTLLNEYQKLDMKVLGVEPTNIADIANQEGVETIKSPFNLEIANLIKKKYGNAQLITATNVFAHMSQLGEVIKGIESLLTKDGFFILENHYMIDILKLNQYDTIYHEHIRNYSLKSLIHLFSIFNMNVVYAEVLQRYQGSIKVVITKDQNFKKDISVEKILRKEEEIGLYEPKIWNEFKNNVIKSKENLLTVISDIKKQGKNIVGNSCPGRCSTLLNYCNINTNLIPYIAEQSTSLKLGKYLPGMHIPIIDNKILKEEQPDFILLLAWHLREPIIKYLREKGIRSSLISPLPQVEIIN